MKAIIIGATSGIGRELARQMGSYGYSLGITGRRTSLLDSLAQELPTQSYKSAMDLQDVSASVDAFETLLSQMGEVDVIIINSGTGSINPDFPLSDELETVAVNVVSFTAIANVAYHYFCSKKQGQIVGISSLAAVRSGPFAAYNASKSFVSAYLEGLNCRSKFHECDLAITDVRPGFVDTEMAKGEGIFWKAPVEKAAKQIFSAIRKKHRVVYVTKRWQVIALILSNLPFKLYRKVIG